MTVIASNPVPTHTIPVAAAIFIFVLIDVNVNFFLFYFADVCKSKVWQPKKANVKFPYRNHFI